MYCSTANTDFADDVAVHPGFYSLADIDQLYARAAVAGFRAVNWRVQVCSRVFMRSQVLPVIRDGDLGDRGPIYEPVLEAYDPPAAAVAAGRKHGVKTLLWFTPIDSHFDVYGGGRKSQIDPIAPYFMRSKDGSHAYEGVSSPAYAECREVWCEFARELMAYGADGLFISWRSHASNPGGRGHWIKWEPNDYGFDPPAIERYRELTGLDPIGADLDVDAWGRVHGEFRTQFFADIRAAVGPEATLYTDIAPTRVNLTSQAAEKPGIDRACPVYNDWETWLRKGYLDALCVHSSRYQDDCSFVTPEYLNWPDQSQIAVWFNIGQIRRVTGKRMKHVVGLDGGRYMADSALQTGVGEVFWHETALFNYDYSGADNGPRTPGIGRDSQKAQAWPDARMWRVLAGEA